MINSIFYIIIFSLFANFAFGSINYFGVNRTFMLMYKGVIESSLNMVDEYGLPTLPYFNREALKENVTFYLETNLPRYVTSYTVNFYFFNEEDKSYSTDKYVTAVKISLKAKINFLYNYEKAREFYVN